MRFAGGSKLAGTGPGRLGRELFIHADNASCVGAFIKGRSNSARLNGRCRRVAATELGLGLGLFIPSVPSGNNPADAPSSKFGIRALKGEELLAAPVIDIPRPITTTGNKPALVFHVCSGAHRAGDFSEHATSYGRDNGVEVLVISFDPVVDASKNLLNESELADMRELAGCKDSFRCLSGPPCSTFSRIRHKNVQNGPRPLHSRADPLEPFPHLTDSEILQVKIGTCLLLRALMLLAIV